jgi:superfamily I DNA/RNA helicase
MSPNVTKIYGPPGTGKTTFLIGKVKEAMADGIHPSDIGYFSFTNKATEEAKDRLAKEFPQFKVDEDFPGFRTLHSLAYQALPSRLKIMSEQEAIAFDPKFFIEQVFMKENDLSSLVIRAKQIVIDAAATARARLIEFDQYLKSIGPADRYRLNKWLGYPAKLCNREFSDKDIYNLVTYNNSFEEYKKNIGVIDYTAILEEALKSTSSLPSYSLLIIDEAQDLSKLQWLLGKVLIEKSKICYVAGDDDQAICESFGADPQEFLNLDGTDFPLTQSYRVPSNIHKIIFNENGIIHLLSNKFKRKDKKWNFRNGNPGKSSNIFNVNDLLNLLKISSENENWLVLSATHSTLNNLSNILKLQNIPHFLSNQLISPDINTSPTIRLMTIWGAKGGESSNVALLRGNFVDEKMMEEDPRLRYVAITRAKNSFIDAFI